MPFANPTEVPINACETVSGRYVDAVNPDPKDICITDIAWSLSRQARFAGHTLSENIWSVAQHSLFVQELIELAIDEGYTPLKLSLERWLSDMFPRSIMSSTANMFKRISLGALMHDASEAYLVDIPSPVKRHQHFREPYKLLEANMMTAIGKALELPEYSEYEQAIIGWGDMLALEIEAANLMPSRGRGWTGKFPQMTIAEVHLMPAVKPWREVYQDFMTEYQSLKMHAPMTR